MIINLEIPDDFDLAEADKKMIKIKDGMCCKIIIPWQIDNKGNSIFYSPLLNHFIERAMAGEWKTLKEYVEECGGIYE